ncbi:MAG TPA: hypothetical protein VHW00_08305 [Thermoanaerobaculia bacterium]|nr:hypothetical protein [Thermoanaerobaculia bacterium]
MPGLLFSPAPLRQKFRTLVICLTAATLTLLLVRLLHARGGPFFEIPETILDHVEKERPLSRDVIVLCRKAELWMPRGSSVTVIAPAQAPHYDFTHHLTACGLLPHHEVRHPSLAEGEEWPRYVLAVGEPLAHRGYQLVAEFPEGRVYARR